MTNKHPVSYPNPQDLEFILADSVRKTDLMSFLRKRGLFFFNISSADLAKQVAAVLWDAEALESFRAMAYRNSNKKILSGFSIYSNRAFDLSAIYNSIRENGTLSTAGYKLNAISKITKESECYYEGTISYEKKSVGRIGFIRTEERDACFVMKQVSDKEWQVEVDGGKSNDGKAVHSMLEKMAKNRDLTISSLRIDYLTKSSTITFFDLLAQKGLSEEWQIEDIGRITLKKDAGTKSESTDENSDETEVGREELSGITQAILEGMNLREHNFVKQAEEAGYAFTSMTYVFYNSDQNVKVKLRAEFKGNPKIFEVAVESYMISVVNQDEGYEESLSNMDDSLNMKLRSMFWNNARSIYYSLLGTGCHSNNEE